MAENKKKSKAKSGSKKIKKPIFPKPRRVTEGVDPSKIISKKND